MYIQKSYTASFSFQNYYSNQTKYTPQGAFMGDQGLKLTEGLGRALNLPIKKVSPPSFLHVSPHPSLDYRPHIGKSTCNSF